MSDRKTKEKKIYGTGGEQQYSMFAFRLNLGTCSMMKTLSGGRGGVLFLPLVFINISAFSVILTNAQEDGLDPGRVRMHAASSFTLSRLYAYVSKETEFCDALKINYSFCDFKIAMLE